jgi:hypothetical protein
MIQKRHLRILRKCPKITNANFVYAYFSIISKAGIVEPVTGYKLEDQGIGVRVLVVARIFTFPCCPDRL